MAKGKKNIGNHKPSSGTLKSKRLNRQIKKLETKVRRWTRYTKEIKSGTRKGSVERWSTEGLNKHIGLLKSFLVKT